MISVRLLFLLLVAVSFLTSCAAIKRSILWRNDPISFLVVMKEDGNCIPIIDGKLSTFQHISEVSVRGDSGDFSSIDFKCRMSDLYRDDSKKSGRSNIASIHMWSWILVLLERAEDNPVIDNQSRVLTYSDSNRERANPEIPILYISLLGPESAGSVFCDVTVEVVEAVLVLYVGQEKNTHVLAGIGNRECSIG